MYASLDPRRDSLDPGAGALITKAHTMLPLEPLQEIHSRMEGHGDGSVSARIPKVDVNVDFDLSTLPALSLHPSVSPLCELLGPPDQVSCFGALR
jgi:hypothetical protein